MVEFWSRIFSEDLIPKSLMWQCFDDNVVFPTSLMYPNVEFSVLSCAKLLSPKPLLFSSC